MSYERLYKVKEVSNSSDAAPKVDVVFSFDTTGSMSSVIESVRSNLTETVDRLFASVEGIRIGIIVHGDYCDFPRMMWVLQPTNNVHEIKEFIKSSPNTGGGDFPECYELALHAATKMQWQSDVKVLVMIGDATPHEPGYEFEYNVSNHIDKTELDLDWRKIAEELKERRITIFSCHAMPESNTDSIQFYDQISRVTGGYYFPLNELQAFKDYMLAICFRAADSADTLQLLETSRRELEIRLKELEERKTSASTVEERTRIETEVFAVATEHNLLAGFCDMSSFAPEVVEAGTKARTKFRSAPTRLDTYAAELRSSSRTDASTEATLDILSDRVSRRDCTSYSTSARPSSTPDETPTAFGSISHHESIFSTPSKLRRTSSRPSDDRKPPSKHPFFDDPVA